MALFSVPTDSGLTVPWKDEDVETISFAAQHFAKAYYESYDNMSHRLELLGKFYTPQSELVWNGNHIVTIEQIGEFFTKMPPTRHDVQAVDCHPIAGTSPPRLMITVTGTMHTIPPSQLTSTPLSVSSAAQLLPIPNTTPSTIPFTDPVLPIPIPLHNSQAPPGQKPKKGKQDVDELPRAFYQVFEMGAKGENGEAKGSLQPVTYFDLLDEM